MKVKKLNKAVIEKLLPDGLSLYTHEVYTRWLSLYVY